MEYGGLEKSVFQCHNLDRQRSAVQELPSIWVPLISLDLKG